MFNEQKINLYWFYFSYCSLVLEYPIDIWANSTIIHYQHWSIIILINILITSLETSYALWLVKTDLFTAIPILRYYQRNCVFIVEKKNNDSCKYHLVFCWHFYCECPFIKFCFNICHKRLQCTCNSLAKYLGQNIAKRMNTHNNCLVSFFCSCRVNWMNF